MTSWSSPCWGPKTYQLLQTRENSSKRRPSNACKLGMQISMIAHQSDWIWRQKTLERGEEYRWREKLHCRCNSSSYPTRFVRKTFLLVLTNSLSPSSRSMSILVVREVDDYFVQKKRAFYFVREMIAIRNLKRRFTVRSSSWEFAVGVAVSVDRFSRQKFKRFVYLYCYFLNLKFYLSVRMYVRLAQYYRLIAKYLVYTVRKYMRVH